MCFNQSSPSPPPPPPLPPPPPPPAPPIAPLPPPEPLETEVNPQVKKAMSDKEKNPYTSGTDKLKIKLEPAVNTGQAPAAPGGGLNV